MTEENNDNGNPPPDPIINYLSQEQILEAYARESIEPNLLFIYFNERLKILEDRVFGKKVKEITRAQRMLLLFHLGMIQPLKDSQGTRQKQAELLSLIIGSSKENIKDDLETIENNKRSELRTISNYKFLVETFKKLGMKDKAEECDKILGEIERIIEAEKKRKEPK